MLRRSCCPCRRPHFQKRISQMNTITVDGSVQEVRPGERLVDLIVRAGIDLPAVCYHPQLGPLQTCDTCLVEVNGQLVRACATIATDGMNVLTKSNAAEA